MDHAPSDLADTVLPHLLSRDPETFWTSGQWRTEKEGGSDLSQIETTARRDPDGTWHLHGHKWFTSSTAANIALVLAQTEGKAGDLTLFHLPIRDDSDASPHDGSRATAVVEHFAAQGIDHVTPHHHYEAYLLANDISNQPLFDTPASGPSKNGSSGALDATPPEQ
jgi:alkylation response protein AidB-like acyl-CoA dehydrogenase